MCSVWSPRSQKPRVLERAAKFFFLKAYGREPCSMAFEALGVIVLVAHSTL